MNQRFAVLRSVAIVSISSHIEYALGLIVSIWIARALGPAEFGRYAFIVWLSGWLMVCSNHALSTSSIKFIAEARGAGSPETAARIAFRLERLQALSSLVVAALFVIIASIVRPDDWVGEMLAIIALIVIAVVAKANFTMLVAISKGQELFEPEAIAKVVVGVAAALLTIIWSLFDGHLLGYVELFAVACLALNLINRMAFRRYGLASAPGPVPADVTARLNRHLLLTGVLILLISLKTRTIETFLLSIYASSVELGYFAIAGTLTNGAVEVFSVGITGTLMTYMAKAYGQGGAKVAAEFLSESIRIYWAMGLTIAGIGLVTAPSLVALLYGHRYAAAVPTIQANLVLGGLILFSAAITAFQGVTDRQDERIRISLLGMAINVALGVLLIPRYQLTGAVATLVGTRLAEIAIMIAFLRRHVASSMPVAAMVRLGFAAALATAAALALNALLDSRFEFLASAALFMAVFIPASIAMRYWTPADLELLLAIAGKIGAPGRAAVRAIERARAARER